MILETIDFVKKELKNLDSSHDWNHIERVWKLALYIAKNEDYKGDLELLQLAAILHDVKDHKYAAKDGTADTATPESAITLFLSSLNYPKDSIAKVCLIVQQISFKNELGNLNQEFLIESKIVQDADRLDAIGAVGISRCFSFGAVHHAKFYDELSSYQSYSDRETKEISQEEYIQKFKSKGSSIDHFYDKLFKLKDMMKTQTGVKLAEQRNQFMISFIKQFDSEIELLK
ncbi:hypothetical protein CYY_010098 [Polysphondylium violaceum]|uniref:HD/PDEase domain-containing protein n=1 Tax=Polysphondylium violaceum TaxID=133409 RepID=A0A8J4UU96_9MYCE|nr:hypothetical protein CYY_010098 [Polysphondylium violaceum]